jgi:DNA-binding winged helix-turn-helix (wHTH) protein
MRYRFADCELDTDSYTLTRAGQPVAVEPQVFDLIRLLAENAGRLVTKDQMIEAIWQGRVVSEASISARISAARAAVGDTGKAQAILRTVPRRGFAFTANVEEIAHPSGHPATGPAPSAPEIAYALSRDGTAIAWAALGEGPPLVRIGHWLSHLEMDSRSRI